MNVSFPSTAVMQILGVVSSGQTVDVANCLGEDSAPRYVIKLAIDKF